MARSRRLTPITAVLQSPRHMASMVLWGPADLDQQGQSWAGPDDQMYKTGRG